MKPTLLRDYLGQNVSGWLMSAKLDGWRLMWNGEDFILRGGGVLNVPLDWKIGMPSCELDGELHAGAGQFNSIQKRIASGFCGLSFHIFDAPSPLPFRKRLQFLQSIALPDHCCVVPHIRCRDTAHLMEFADAIVGAGGEGCVVRNPKASYEEGRTYSTLRWVPQCPALNRF